MYWLLKMKRTINLSVKLPAFNLKLDELEALTQIIENLFDKDSRIHKWIKVRLKNEDLDFDSVNELRGSPYLKENITEFKIHYVADDSSISITTNHILDQAPSFSASSTKVGWCQQAEESICPFINRHKSLRSFIVNLPFIRTIFGLLILGVIIATNLPSGYELPQYLIFSFFGLIASLSFFMVVKDKLFPGAKIIIDEDEPIYRRYAVELGLFFAFISMILSGIALFK
jgi:hypothetical protein